MNGVNVLFILSCIFVPLLLISLNYSTIDDFYKYSVPLKNMVISKYTDISITFQEVMDRDSECFTTLNENLFCYLMPTMYAPGHGASFVKGESGIEGEIHFDLSDVGVSYFTMKNMTLISDNTALVTFADKNYGVGNKDETTYEITEKFEFSTVIKKFDTFIVKCNDYEGTSVTLVQYLGIDTIDGIDYFLTWHTSGDLKNPITCDYPQIIQHSLKHNFREL